MCVQGAASLRLQILTGLAITCALALTAVADGQSRIEWIGDLTYPNRPNFPTWPTAISNDGAVVVGYARTTEGDQVAFRWTHDEGIASIGDLPGSFTSSVAAGVSGDGKTIVGQGRSDKGYEAFAWTAEGGMVGLDDLPGGAFRSQASAASADGRVIVGLGEGINGTEAFIWTAESGMVGLGHLPGYANSSAIAVNSAGDRVLGIASSDTAAVPFLWTKETGMVGLGSFSGMDETNPCAMADDGSVIVGWGINAGDQWATGFQWTAADGYVPLADLPGGAPETKGLAISSAGGVIGGRGWDELGTQATVWTDPTTVRKFKEYVLTEYQLDTSDWQLSDVFGVSGDGRGFMGFGLYDGAPYQGLHAWVAHVEPSCEVDCSADGQLDLFDFLCFVNSFNAADPDADCTDDGAYDLFDFLCFVNAFNEGC